MIKIGFLLFVVFTTFVSIAQEPIVAIEFQEVHILYRGYPNRLIPAVTNNDGRIVGLKSTNATIQKNVESKQKRPA